MFAHTLRKIISFKPELCCFWWFWWQSFKYGVFLMKILRYHNNHIQLHVFYYNFIINMSIVEFAQVHWPYHSRTSVARTSLARLPQLFRTRFWVPWKNPTAADLGWFIFFILKMVCCVYSLESPHRGDSNENTQHTIILKKIEKISLLCLPTWCYD